MKTGVIVLGYHGCDQAVGESILAGETSLKLSKNKHDWLGHGIYFWENNPKRAWDWAKFMSTSSAFKGRVNEPFAIGAAIDLGNCLDLTESESLGLVKASYQELAFMNEIFEIPLPENKSSHQGDEDLVKRYLDCAVINNVHALREEKDLEAFTTVRAPFTGGGELYPGSKIQAKTHIQVCVRDSRQIRGVFRIKEPSREQRQPRCGSLLRSATIHQASVAVDSLDESSRYDTHGSGYTKRLTCSDVAAKPPLFEIRPEAADPIGVGR